MPRKPDRRYLFTALALVLGLPIETMASETSRVAELLADANRRSASGEAPEIIERWLVDSMQRMGARTSPEPWDVFARARWQADENGATPTFVVRTTDATVAPYTSPAP
ncbi:hypothetical protein EC912_103239 [Luteibacter rhizovicinus]|uniref:Uncharacterized protein n=1 Tax=Luteibacter rhizovicinus TaxID=242606 RepID=A0A4R3YTT7_9GAMM|nr:hypothetical protein [Luteibacter rhizovicinus]TCV94754.1 hypothetical protein EC912_103239 [Luteibacter rhizovicinus]